jgi:hypothetical protein
LRSFVDGLMKKIAIATCVKLPEPDVDEELLFPALEKAGASVRMLAWDDPEARVEKDELVVIRSTWNYFEDVERFLHWVDATSAVTRVLNPASIVRGNAKKTYLRDLETRGIDIVPTAYVMHDEKRRIDEIAHKRGWSAIVVKPTVSAGSFLTERFDLRSEVGRAQTFLDKLTTEHQRDAMIQRWMPSVDTHGERSLVWIDGELTHAIRKSPRFVGGQEAVSPEVPIAEDERAFALRVLEPIATELLYARVDVVRDEEGVLRLMELELIEPSLFLKQCKRALDRLVAAIVRRA